MLMTEDAFNYVFFLLIHTLNYNFFPYFYLMYILNQFLSYFCFKLKNVFFPLILNNFFE